MLIYLLVQKEVLPERGKEEVPPRPPRRRGSIVEQERQGLWN